MKRRRIKPLPRTIVIGGTCGSGKSTIGIALAHRLEFEFHDGDDYHSTESRAKMSAGIPLTDEDRFPWLKKLSSLAASNDHPFSPTNGVIIACSALKKQYREILVRGKTLSNCHIVMLLVSESTLATRLEERKGHFFNKYLLPSQLAALELPTTMSETTSTQRDDSEPYLLVVNGENSVDNIVQTIIDELMIM